jgi:hypothetical protein
MIDNNDIYKLDPKKNHLLYYSYIMNNYDYNNGDCLHLVSNKHQASSVDKAVIGIRTDDIYDFFHTTYTPDILLDIKPIIYYERIEVEKMGSVLFASNQSPQTSKIPLITNNSNHNATICCKCSLVIKKGDYFLDNINSVICLYCAKELLQDIKILLDSTNLKRTSIIQSVRLAKKLL